LRKQLPPNGGVDAAARIKAPFAAPSKLRNTLPPLASNDLFGIVQDIANLRLGKRFDGISAAAMVINKERSNAGLQTAGRDHHLG